MPTDDHAPLRHRHQMPGAGWFVLVFVVFPAGAIGLTAASLKLRTYCGTDQWSHFDPFALLALIGAMSLIYPLAIAGGLALHGLAVLAMIRFRRRRMQRLRAIRASRQHEPE